MCSHKDSLEYCEMDVLSNIAVFVVETRYKRYGFNALLGAVFIIAADTGGALDYAVNIDIVLNVKK